MDERNVEASCRGLGADLADALADALDRTVGTSGIAERERAAEQEDRAALLRAMRESALDGCRQDWKSGREYCAGIMEQAIVHYCTCVRKQISEKGKSDPRFPETINYIQRYEALCKVGSRDVLLGRLEQTLDLADEILANVTRIDIDGYFSDAAAFYRMQVMKLEGIAVAEPVRDAAEEHAKDQEQGIADALRVADDAATVGYEDALAALDEQLEKAFADESAALGVLDGFETDADAEAQAEAGAFKAEVGRLIESLDEVENRMAQHYAEACEANAALVATSRLSLGDLPAFDGAVSGKLAYNLGEVVAFAAEVRRSFATYKQVVEDNGVYVAFSDGPDFGCRERSSSCGGIPSEIEEDDVEGGDSPARATEKLRELNRRRYFGLLDEDFAIHVEAFWYGFRKLMEFTNGLFELKPREFVDYCDALRDSTVKRARALGVLMSDDQVADFAEQVRKLVEED